MNTTTQQTDPKYLIAGSSSHWYYHRHPSRCEGRVISEGDDYVCWVIDDNGEDGYTEAEAVQKLRDRANRNGDLFYYDADSDDPTDHPEPITDEEGRESLPKWYYGAGLYSCDHDEVLLNRHKAYEEEGVIVQVITQD